MDQKTQEMLEIIQRTLDSMQVTIDSMQETLKAQTETNDRLERLAGLNEDCRRFLTCGLN